MLARAGPPALALTFLFSSVLLTQGTHRPASDPSSLHDRLPCLLYSALNGLFASANGWLASLTYWLAFRPASLIA